MRTLKQIKPKDIKIGEIFAYEGCWVIIEKRAKNEYMILDNNIRDIYGDLSGKTFTLQYLYFCRVNELVAKSKNDDIETIGIFDFNTNCYKLPLSVQRLWNANI